MKFLIILASLILCSYYISAFDFTDIISANGFCDDTESITIDRNLKLLDIYDCRNIFPLNPSVYSFNIIHLILSENAITNLTKEYFNELGKTVQNLELIKNNVSQMEENVFESLKRLTQLKIVEPKLTLKNLILSDDCKQEKLHLELQSFDPQMLSKLPKEMRNITIENTFTFSKEFSIPIKFINLIYLRLSNCSIEIWNESEATFSALESLDLSHNKLEGVPLISEKYPNLLTLILSYNRISSIGEKAFKSLESLEKLRLNNNNIHFVNFNAFSNNMKLIAVDLSHNSLKHISLNYTNLHKYHVEVKSNLISCDDLNDVPAYLNTDIIHCSGINVMMMIMLSILVCILLLVIVGCQRQQILKSFQIISDNRQHSTTIIVISLILFSMLVFVLLTAKLSGL